MSAQSTTTDETMETPRETADSTRKKKVRMLALNLSERDLSIALVMLKEFALQDPVLADNYDFHLHQWMKDYARLGEEGTLGGLDVERVVDELDPEGTDVFGFSMYIWSHDFMLEVARRLKARNPDAVMLFGGSQAGGYGARLLEEYPQVDFVLKGEAEYSFRDFLHGLLVDDFTQVSNLYYRQDERVRTNVPTDKRAAKKMSYLKSIESLPMPFRSQEYRQYLDNLDHKVTAQFETERGCPLSCAFCSWGTRLPIRRRQQQDVEEGLTYLLNHPNVRAVYIVDANPFIKDEKGLWLTEFLLHKNKTGKPVYFELNPEYIRDPRVIENLGKLQGDELAFGLQSTSDVTLKKIKRKFHRDVYEKNVKRLRALSPKANIKFSLILGLPGDTYTSFTESLDFVIGMQPSDIYVHDLLILPGSEMYSDPEQFGIAIDRKPPHRLLWNETFPWEDYNEAKYLGFHVKLLHKFHWLRDQMLDLHSKVGGRVVDLYNNFVHWMGSQGVDALDGENVGDVSSEEFDFRTQRFVDQKNNLALLKSLFLSFRHGFETLDKHLELQKDPSKLLMQFYRHEVLAQSCPQLDLFKHEVPNVEVLAHCAATLMDSSEELRVFALRMRGQSQNADQLNEVAEVAGTFH